MVQASEYIGGRYIVTRMVVMLGGGRTGGQNV